MYSSEDLRISNFHAVFSFLFFFFLFRWTQLKMITLKIKLHLITFLITLKII